MKILITISASRPSREYTVKSKWKEACEARRPSEVVFHSEPPRTIAVIYGANELGSWDSDTNFGVIYLDV